MPMLESSISVTCSVFAGSVKLGQPLPESNFASDENSSLPHAAQVYAPCSLLWSNAPVNGASVPARRSTAYCSGVSDCRHCSSDFFISSITFSNQTLIQCRRGAMLNESNEHEIARVHLARTDDRDRGHSDTRCDLDPE